MSKFNDISLTGLITGLVSITELSKNWMTRTAMLINRKRKNLASEKTGENRKALNFFNEKESQLFRILVRKALSILLKQWKN